MTAQPLLDRSPMSARIRVTPVPDRAGPRVDPEELPRLARRESVRQPGLFAVLPGGSTATAAAVKSPEDFGPRATPTAELPDAGRWAGGLAPILLQVAGGARPAPQVMRHTSPEVYESLVRRHLGARRRGTARRRPGRLRRVRVCEVRDGVVEAGVVVDDGHRARAMALRLDGLDGRWVVTALNIG